MLTSTLSSKSGPLTADAKGREKPPVPTRLQQREKYRKARERFLHSRRTERSFARALSSVAVQIGRFVKGFAPTLENLANIKATLEAYANLLHPWARSVVTTMMAEVDQRDKKAWIETGREMGRALERELRTAPTGTALEQRLEEQVDLITSLPRSAAERVHRLTIKGITEGVRSEEIQEEIERTGLVTRARANLIARTEVARTASVLTQVRAEALGSEGYIWRTALDGVVRPIHRRLEGKFIRWDDPPIAGERGERAHAGQIYNCRCWAEPVIPDAA